MKYNRCGKSGVLLTAISHGLWHNFEGIDCNENERSILRMALDLGNMHFDQASNYRPAIQ